MWKVRVCPENQCQINKHNRLPLGGVYPNFSNLLRKVNAIKYTHNKRVTFGNESLNSFGSWEGGPGGYGSIPKNKF